MWNSVSLLGAETILERSNDCGLDSSSPDFTLSFKSRPVNQEDG